MRKPHLAVNIKSVRCHITTGLVAAAIEYLVLGAINLPLSECLS